MKTRKEIEDALYERSFANETRNHKMFRASGIVMLIGIVCDVIFRLCMKKPEYTFETTLTIEGLLFLLVCIAITLFELFIHIVDLPKERQKLISKIEKARKEIEDIQAQPETSHQFFVLGGTKRIDYLTEEIIILIVRLKRIGGTPPTDEDR